MSKKENCGNCRHWDSKEKECHKRSPYPNLGMGGERFPSVKHNNWCGEFEQSQKEGKDE